MKKKGKVERKTEKNGLKNGLKNGSIRVKNSLLG